VRAPAPELITAIVLTGLAVRARSVGELAALCLLAAGGVTLGFIDAAVHRLPDLLTLPLYGSVTALLAATAATGHQWGALLRAVIAGAVLACFYFALLIALPAGIGAGDGKLALAVGTVLGWYGWPILFAGTIYAFLAAAAYALGLLALRRSSRKDRFAFGPFLLAGALVAIVI
jgi:leader peptidase (prepilin peptidase)/N-methyltransferase